MKRPSQIRNAIVFSTVMGGCALSPQRTPASSHVVRKDSLQNGSTVFESTEADSLPMPELGNTDGPRGVARIVYSKEKHECAAGSKPQFFKPVPKSEFDPFIAQFLYRTYYGPGTVASLRSQMGDRGVLRSEPLYAALAVCVDQKTGRLVDGQVFAIQGDSTLSYAARLKRRRLAGTVRFYDQGRLKAEVGYDNGAIQEIEYFDPLEGRRVASSSLASNFQNRDYMSGFADRKIDRKPLSWDKGRAPRVQRISDGTCY